MASLATIVNNINELWGRRSLQNDPVYPVREQYIVYEPLAERFIAIVAAIRQGRDISAILLGPTS
jgi:hypothetical protein